MKRICQIHSFVYTGCQCPICIQERSKRMSDRHEKRQIKFEHEVKQEPEKDLDWSDLANKFNIVSK